MTLDCNWRAINSNILSGKFVVINHGKEKKNEVGTINIVSYIKFSQRQRLSMIGLAQPQTTGAMGYKNVSQPYTNYLNVTTIKTTFLANRSTVFSHGTFAPNEIKSKCTKANTPNSVTLSIL